MTDLSRVESVDEAVKIDTDLDPQICMEDYLVKEITIPMYYLCIESKRLFFVYKLFLFLFFSGLGMEICVQAVTFW